MRIIRNKKTLLQSLTQPGMPIEWPHAAMPRRMVQPGRSHAQIVIAFFITPTARMLR